MYGAGAYSELCQTFNREPFTKIISAVYCFHKKLRILDVLLGSEYASVGALYTLHTLDKYC